MDKSNSIHGMTQHISPRLLGGKVQIVLVEDHQIVRQGLRTLLQSEPDFEIVAEASNGLGVVDLVEQLKPTILLLDLMIPGLNGMEVTRQCRQRCPDTGIVILTMHADEGYVLQSLANGACGYVLKDSSSSELVTAIHEVSAGRRYLSAPFSERAIDSYIQRARESSIDAYESLTTREREVLQLVAESYTNVEIAEALSISPRTAEVHRANFMRKLGLRTQTELIRYAIRRGILGIDN